MVFRLMAVGIDYLRLYTFSAVGAQPFLAIASHKFATPNRQQGKVIKGVIGFCEDSVHKRRVPNHSNRWLAPQYCQLRLWLGLLDCLQGWRRHNHVTDTLIHDK